MSAATDTPSATSSRPTWREHAWAQGLCAALLVVTQQLWNADLRVPFFYQQDAFFTLMLAKGGSDTGSYFENPLLGA
ncbi:MAG TPA: hypothetical protein VGQ57_09095, partial [Polyangiaceae bacterium]|nr:hypothetical protein [Polyangiaceae bacterium]